MNSEGAASVIRDLGGPEESMDWKQDISISFADREKQQKSPEALFEERRQYNRQSMRRWRADLSHHAYEPDNRQRCYHERKSQKVQGNGGLYASDRGESVCGSCRQRPSLEEVVRVQICDSAPSGF
jgi:hypothetical protein